MLIVGNNCKDDNGDDDGDDNDIDDYDDGDDDEWLTECQWHLTAPCYE